LFGAGQFPMRADGFHCPFWRRRGGYEVQTVFKAKLGPGTQGALTGGIKSTRRRAS